MKKRFLYIAAFLLTVVVLCICTLPVKTEIHTTLPGGRIDFEGNLLSDEPVTIQGWLRNYLLKDDTMELHLTLPDLTTRTNSVKPYRIENWPEESFICQGLSVYVSEWNLAAFPSVYLAKDGSWYLVRLNNRLYYGSAEGGPSPAEIIAITGVTKD